MIIDSHREVHKMIWNIFDLKEENRPVPWGSSSRFKRDRIPILFANLGFNKGAEIGVRRGKFSRQFCEANRNLHLFCIDPWMAYHVRYDQDKQDAIYRECVNNLTGLNVTFIRKTSMDAVKDIVPDSLDFAYIDGDHSFDFIMEDIICWSKCVRPGGIVACHDYHHGHNVEVVFAVDAYTRAHHIDPWYVTKESQPTAYWVKP